MELSIKQYAERLKISRFTVIKQINDSRLPKGVKARKVGSMYVLTVTQSSDRYQELV